MIKEYQEGTKNIGPMPAGVIKRVVDDKNIEFFEVIAKDKSIDFEGEENSILLRAIGTISHKILKPLIDKKLINISKHKLKYIAFVMGQLFSNSRMKDKSNPGKQTLDLLLSDKKIFKMIADGDIWQGEDLTRYAIGNQKRKGIGKYSNLLGDL